MRTHLSVMLLAAAIGSHGQTEVDSLLTTDGYRTYRIHTPPGFTPGEHLPLVLNLHGVGSDPAQQEVYSGMNAVADTARFVVVYPSGVNNSWNLGLGTVDEYGFFTALLDTLAITHGIDPGRIYACGMSQGGFMSFVLACALFDRIAAIATVAGSMAPGLDLFCAPSRPVPVMMVHGTADGIVPFTGGIQNLSVSMVIDFWVAHNGCDPVPVITPVPNLISWDLCTAEREDHLNGDQGSTVTLIRIIDGGHTWPGSAIPLGVTNQDLSASAEIWAFFAGYDLNGALSTAPAPEGPFEVTLAPTAFTDRVDLRHHGAADVQVAVHDTQGRIVHHLVLGPRAEVSVDASAWPAGGYIWRFTTSSGVTTRHTLRVR